MTLAVPLSKRRLSFRGTLVATAGMAALVTVCMVCTYGMSQRGGPLAATTLGGSSRSSSSRWTRRRALASTSLPSLDLISLAAITLSVSRPKPGARLEHAVDASPELGACYHQQPLLPGMPERACQPLHCLWSEALQQNVDLLFNPLRPLPHDAHPARCPEPEGGQGPVPLGEAPRVSFVVAMRGDAKAAAESLLEMFRTAHEVDSAEFVLVNDGSKEDASGAVQAGWHLEQLFGVRFIYIVNNEPLGYGAANNRGVEAATGEFVVLANNHMFAVKGWLWTLLVTFRERPDAGVVGPLVLGGGNLIKGAGGIVYNGAQLASFGSSKRVWHEVSYLREVDFLSSACIVFRKALFMELGGFDVECEACPYGDADFAMAVRASGHKALLQPLAVVYYQGDPSDLPDLSGEVVAESRDRFIRKWGSSLPQHCPPTATAPVAAGRYSWPRVLWVDDIVPEPDRDAGSIRSLNIMRILLGEGYHISLLPISGGREAKYVAQARALGIHVITPNRDPQSWRLTYVGTCAYDVIFVARRGVYQAAQQELAKQCPGVPTIYDTVDLHFLREARDIITTKDSQQRPTSSWDEERVGIPRVLEWLESGLPEAADVLEKRELELGLMDKANLTLVVSPDEAEVIHHYRPETKVAVLATIHEVPESLKTVCKDRGGMLFVGNMNHLPNRQAVEVLIREVLPAVLKLLPEELQGSFVLHVVGSNVVPESLQQLFYEHRERVIFHGNLPDDQLRVLYHRVKVAVAPLLSGAGVKGKVNQAMKYGVPVVGTPVAVEGMHAQDGEDCLIGSDPHQFASKLVHVYTDCQMWSRLVEGGHRSLKQHFSVQVARPVVMQVFNSVGMGPQHGSLRSMCRPLQHQPVALVKKQQWEKQVS